MTRRLIAITLVLLLLLSLCGCMAEEPIEEISRPETTRTTPATTLSTAPTTTATVTITDTTGVTTDATTDTATQTATTVVTTQVITKVTVTATDPTAAPTTAAPQKPAIEWNVIKGKLPEDGITPGAAFPHGKAIYCRLYGVKIKDWEPFEHYGEIIESVAELDALAWNDPEYAKEQGALSQKPIYTEGFFEKNVLIEFAFNGSPSDMLAEIRSATLDKGMLYLHISTVMISDGPEAAILYPTRILVEIPREDAMLVEELVVYESKRFMTYEEIQDLAAQAGRI